MNNRMIDDFSHRYHANINTLDSAKHGDHYRRYDNYNAAPGSAMSQSYYIDPYSRKVEIEMPLRSFEDLVNNNYEADMDHKAARDEAHIRRQFPSVAEAYAQYKMLLELCR
jgi:hypothetical protein